MFRTNHRKLGMIVGAMVAVAVIVQVFRAESQAVEAEPDMNDRIIAATAKCVAAGMEPQLESAHVFFGDTHFVICAPPGGKESNLDRMMRQMNMPEQFKPPKKQTPPNPDSFETKSKVTQ